MLKKSCNDYFSNVFKDKTINVDNYETTYNSSYGKFYPESNNKSYSTIKIYQNYATNTLTNYNLKTNKYHKNKNLEIFVKESQEDKHEEKHKLMCPNCINEKIIRTKSMARLKRKKVYETEFFEDKMRTVHENKKKKDIINREFRAKNTYVSLFRNRERSAGHYKNLAIKNKENDNFGQNIEYGMMRCRNRELENDKKLFGLYFVETNDKKNNINNNSIINIKEREKNLTVNKSWILPKNYLLNKEEYNFIINKQMEKETIKVKRERIQKIREENDYLNYQIKKEKNDINKEISYKRAKINEMNKINSKILKEKKIEEYKQKIIKNQEKSFINSICQKQFEDMKRKLRQKKLRDINIEKENIMMSEKKKMKNQRDKIIMNRKYEGLVFKGVEKNKCGKCNKLYPKNVLTYI